MNENLATSIRLTIELSHNFWEKKKIQISLIKSHLVNQLLQYRPHVQE